MTAGTPGPTPLTSLESTLVRSNIPIANFKVGHDAFECPVRFYSRTNQCMPGFDQAGNRLMNYWYDTAEMLGPSKEITAEWLAHTWQTGELLNKDKHNGMMTNLRKRLVCFAEIHGNLTYICKKLRAL